MMGIEVERDGFVIDGKKIPVWSGSFHYWRHERALWPAILDNISAMGFKMVCTYIPWEVHETAPGEFDFGQVDERKDLGAFLDLLKQRGFWALVRPGPHINSELSYFGYPRRVLVDPRCQARDARGAVPLGGWGIKHFPIPSYASDKFYEEVAVYFDALMPILKPRVYPDGAIAGIQSDNENCFFFSFDAYDLDYSDGSVTLFREMLQKKYGEIEKLNDLYGTSYADFAEVPAPAGFEGKSLRDLPPYLDWVEYKEYHIVYALNRVAKMFKERGISDIPVFHNGCGSLLSPYNFVAIEKANRKQKEGAFAGLDEVDVMGFDIYTGRQGYGLMKEACQYLSGTSVMPFIPELGSGIWVHHGEVFTPDEQEFILLTGLMHGLRAVNFYMLVERDRWVGCPITRDNRIRSDYFDLYRRLSEMLASVGFWSCEKEREIVVLASSDLARFDRAYSVLDFNARGIVDFPRALRLPEARLDLSYDYLAGSHRWRREVVRTLSRASYGFDQSDTNMGLERLGQYRVACVETADFLSEQVQRKLAAYARAEGRVVFGPTLPYLGMDMRPCNILAEAANGPDAVSFSHLKDGISAEAVVGSVPVRRDYWVSEGEAELSVFRKGDDVLLFAANPREELVEIVISFHGKRRLRGVWRAEDGAARDSVRVRLAPYTISVWEVRESA